MISILRQNLRTMLEKSPLMDAESYVREMEQAFIDLLNAERNRQ